MVKSLVSLASFAFAFGGTGVGAQELEDDRPRAELTLSDDTLQVRYIDSGKNVDLGRGSRAAAGVFLSEERDIVLNADVLFPADRVFNRLELLFGPRAYAALLENENEDVLAVSLGVEMRYELDPGSGLAVAGQAFYAPDILTFGSANNLTDLMARVELQVQPRLTAYAGMRWFEFELPEGAGKRTLQEELFAGIGWRF